MTSPHQGPYIGVAPGQGAQKREKEMLNDRFPPRLLYLSDKQSGCLRLFPELPPPPPHLRHFHLCSLGPSEEYEMAARKWGCIRSPWFFESHLKSRSSSHSAGSSEFKDKGNEMHLPKMCPSARESEVLSIRPSPQSYPPERSALLFPREQSSF